VSADGDGFRGITFSYNVRSQERVREVRSFSVVPTRKGSAPSRMAVIASSRKACSMTETMIDSVRGTDGFLVADASGRLVGHVESPMYGTSPEEPDAVAVRSGVFFHRHFLVPASAIAAVDETSEVIGLRLERRQLQRFL
jgi:hypothetical protein